MDSEVKQNQSITMNSTKVYNPEWETLPIFKGWLVNGDRGILFAKCQACDRHLRAQRNDIFKHSQSVKHRSNMVKLGLMNHENEETPEYPIKRFCTPKPGMKKMKLERQTATVKPEISDRLKNSLISESDDGSFTFEVMDKYENNYADHLNSEVVEYLHEEQIIEDYDVASNSSYQLESLQEPSDPQKIKLKSHRDQTMSPTQANMSTSGKSSLFTESECEIFGVFIANEMKVQSFAKRRHFKRKVLQLLLEMEDE